MPPAESDDQAAPVDGLPWGSEADTATQVRLAVGAVAGDPLLGWFLVESSPSALVIALTCQHCRSVVTISRARAFMSAAPEPLTLAELVAVADTHVERCPNAPVPEPRAGTRVFEPASSPAATGGEQLVDQVDADDPCADVCHPGHGACCGGKAARA